MKIKTKAALELEKVLERLKKDGKLSKKKSKKKEMVGKVGFEPTRATVKE